MSIAGSVGPDGIATDVDRVIAACARGRRPHLLRHADMRMAAVDPARAHGGTIAQPFDIVLDGSLHYQDDLRAAIGSDARDAALLAAGYARHGVAFFDRLAGDFAFALWDRTRRRLILGRDPVAMRPLFFWHRDARLIFASSTRALHAAPCVPRDLDVEQVARGLVWWPEDHPQSHFRDIARVPPGQLAIFEDGRVRYDRWWRPEDAPTVRLKDGGEYADALRHILDEAVAERLPSEGPVAISLSGGLDSTAVCALAARRLAAGGRQLIACTMVPAMRDDVPAGTGLEVDEFARAGMLAARHANIVHIPVPTDPTLDLFTIVENRSRFSDVPTITAEIAGHFDAMMQVMADCGCKVALGGGLGNFTISHHGYPAFAGLLRSGALATWARLAWQARRRGTSVAALANLSLGPLLPPAFHRRVLAAFGRGGGTDDALLPLAADFAAATGIGPPVKEVDRASPRAARIALLQRADRGPALHTIAARFGVAPTDPTSDRRVIEFCLGIPEAAFMPGGEPRGLIRRAMRGLVPDAILDSPVRGRQGGDWHRSLDASRARIAEELERIERSPLARQCLDLPRLRALVDDWPTGRWDDPMVQRTYRQCLTRGLALGHFLRRFEGGNG